MRRTTGAQFHSESYRVLTGVDSITLGRVSALHQKWVRRSPAGAMSPECQELNALYSLAVDGGSVKVPDRLTKLPDADSEPFVLDELHNAAQRFAETFHQTETALTSEPDKDPYVAADVIMRLLSSESATMSEYELVSKAIAIARKHSIDFNRYLSHIDFGALSTAEKYILSTQLLNLKEEDHPYIWNRYVA